MSDFLLLVKAVSASNVNFKTDKKTGKKKNRRGTFISPLIGGIFMALIFCYVIIMQNFGATEEGYELTTELAQMQATWVFSFSIIWAIFISATQAIYIFYTSNNEQFLPLPISGGKLFLARMFRSFYLSLCNAGILSFGMSLSICISFGFGVGSYFMALLFALLVSVIAASISFVIASLFAMIMPFKKHHAYTTVVVVIFAIIAAFSIGLEYALLPTPLYLDEGIDYVEMYNSFSWITWIGYVPSKGLVLSEAADIQYIFYMILITLGSLLVAYLFGNFFYIRTLEERGNRRKKKPVEKDMQKIDKVFSLATSHPVLFYFRKELITLKKHTGMLMNALWSCIVVIVTVITLGSLGISALQDYGYSDSLVVMVIHLTICTSLWFPFITYSLVSLEGKNMLTYKTIPVDTKKLMLAKMLPGFVLSSIVALILNITYGVVYMMNPIAVIFMFLSSVAYGLLAISMVLAIGTRFARFTYVNQMELLNRGWGPFLISITNLLLPVVILFFDILFIGFDPWYMLIAFSLEIIACTALAKVMFDLAVKLFNKKLGEDMSF